MNRLPNLWFEAIPKSTGWMLDNGIEAGNNASSNEIELSPIGCKSSFERSHTITGFSTIIEKRTCG
ncbi:MAG: hypothetical protein LBS35_02245, partial [Synergistaceae bacterium]|nr:hypothetical protein [Synergistaceae bacterium]